jgi:hypothetical protein
MLDTSAGVSATALGRVAQGANRGPYPSAASPDRIFGHDMPLIAPGSPGNSWLMYKVDLAPLPTTARPAARYACTSGLTEPAAAFVFAPLVPQAQRSADARERAVLSDYLLGREMPFPSLGAGSYEQDAMTFDEREKLRLWIQSLSPSTTTVPECGGCGELPATFDAGAP